MNENITLFRDTYETHNPHFLHIDEALARIKDGVYKTKVSQLRRYKTVDEEKYRQVKTTLPAFVFQGTFRRRANSALQESSGFFTADIDKIGEELSTLSQQLAADPYVYSSFISPSNNGIKAIFRIPHVKDNNEYHFIFEKIAEYIFTTYHIHIDEACKDIARICYASDFPGLTINAQADIFPIEWKEYTERQDREAEKQAQRKREQLANAAKLKKELTQNSANMGKLDELCHKKLLYHQQWMVDCLSNASPSDPQNGRHQCYIKCGILAKSMLDGYAAGLTSVDELSSHVASIRSDFRPVDKTTFETLAKDSTEAEPITKADIWANYQEWKKDHPATPKTQGPPHPADMAEDKTEDKQQTTTGPKPGKSTQLSLFLTSRHTLQYNKFTRSPFIDGKEWDENTLRILHVESVDANFRGKTFIEDVAITACLQKSFDPFTDYFTNLSWDKKNHIKDVCSYIHTASDEFFERALTRWAVQAIAKAKDGTQNEVLILAGAQNVGKSLFVRWICPGSLHDYFVECGTIDPSDKDDKIMLCSNFIGEIGEMGSTTLKETRALKDFLTKKEVKVRAPYDRRPVKRLATMSFIGTENPDGAGFLRDVTGARRFNVVDVIEIDFGYSKKCDIDQFWAQAYSLYLKKADVSFSVQESNIRMAMIQSHTQQSEEMEYLLQYFIFTGDPIDMLYATDILHHMTENGYPRNNRGGAMMIAKALKGCGGIERVRGERGTEYWGIKIIG